MSKIKVLVSGLPGKMAMQIATAIVNSEDMELIPFGLTGPDVIIKNIVCAGVPVQLFDFNERETLVKILKETENRPDIVVDFTAPAAVKGNFEFYWENDWPFVLGTTFGEFDGLDKYIRDMMKSTSLNAVIAPNMAKEVVAFQAMIEFLANNFSGAFSGSNLRIVESHQSTKPDPSGTAIGLIKHFNKMGMPFTKEQIEKVRTNEEHEAFGVPAEHRGRHGWHTYSLAKPDDSVFLEFKHNINGGQAYVDGAMDAIRFLAKVENTNVVFGKVFSMVDVLKG